MALDQAQMTALGAEIKKLQPKFGTGFVDMLAVTLHHVFGPATPALPPDRTARLVRDAERTLNGPLPDADIVVIRQRFLYLCAEGLGLSSKMPKTWTDVETERSLEGWVQHFRAAQCPRRGTTLRFLEGLVAWYADQAATQVMLPQVTAWVEATARNLVDHLQADPTDLNLVITNLWLMVHDEMWRQLSRRNRGELGVQPQQIRERPFLSHQERKQQAQSHG